MARENLFTMRISREEREQLAVLAKRERQPAADVIRALVRRAVEETERPACAEALLLNRP